ncbi:DUF4124 domain-containing protein [Pseudomarimonas arenosa]|uniref:DUF4124 domain-containing protein n=1 Tax=Pseudomarimonas arenosa TaxID=2774145 RepID=A0AAW3ZNI3_9GAMM|nr:DUF4124 domain-containing protein [Pseudomarimonas arenosa]MBD8527656.1 DUF4124 domain-containing protein [Pseudomarimonas arenosa]
MNLLRLTGLLLGLLLSMDTLAALHKCVDASGKSRYSDIPCPEQEQAEVKPMPGGLNALALNGAVEGVAGLHPTWMQTPAYLQHQVRCMGQLCMCGSWEFKKSEAEQHRLLNALDNLPNLWQRYDALSRERNQRDWAGKQPQSAEGLQRVACEIRVEQKILVELFPKLVPDLVDRHSRSLEWIRRTNERCREPAVPRNHENEAAWYAYQRCRDEASNENSRATQKAQETRDADERLREAMATLELPRPDNSR